jgi:hypothetical protein
MLCQLALFRGIKIFLTFSLLDVPLISRGLWPGFPWQPGIPEGLKFFLTFFQLDVP